MTTASNLAIIYCEGRLVFRDLIALLNAMLDGLWLDHMLLIVTRTVGYVGTRLEAGGWKLLR
jgi:hypothetical protein